jgi:hypothetical protein
MPAQITLPIVGSQFPNKGKKAPARRFAIELCEPGDPIKLVQEPDNPADENAIAVFSVENVQMGYLPAERAPYVGLQMSRGEVSAIFQGKGPRSSFCRIAFDGEKPELPSAETDTKASEQDWWPDDIWEDD